MRLAFLIVIATMLLTRTAYSQPDQEWMQEAKTFADEIEEYIFKPDGRSWTQYKKDIANLAEDDRLVEYQHISFIYAVSLDVDNSQQMQADYKLILDSIGGSRHRTNQSIINTLNGVSESGDYEQASVTLTQIVDSSSTSNAHKLMSLIGLAYIQYDNGKTAAALRSLQSARRVTLEGSVPPLLAIELEKMASYVLRASGDHLSVLNSLRTSRELHKKHDLTYESSEIITYLGWMMGNIGEYEIARELNQKKINALTDESTASEYFLTMLSCASVEIELSAYTNAMDCLSTAEKYLHVIPERESSWQVLNVRALARIGDAKTARKQLDALRNDPKMQLSSFVNARLPLLESEVLLAENKTLEAYETLFNLRKDETVRNTIAQKEIAMEMRSILDSETERILENAELKENLAGRQRFSLLLLSIIASGFCLFTVYLVLRRRRERTAAIIDPLTKVQNRRGFWGRLEKEIQRADVRNERLCLGLIDLDGFKLINDSFGHTAGDEILARVGATLKMVLGKDAIVGRLGGDEFAFVLNDNPSDTFAQQIGNRVCEVLKQETQIGKWTLRSEGSIGLAVFPDAAETAKELYDCADYALYSKKASGPGEAQFFDLSQKSKLDRQRSIESALIEADFSEFELYYQPIISAESKNAVGFEALARWTSPELGAVSPGEFIPLAERTSQIRRLTLVLLERALEDAKKWPEHLSLSINLSSQDLSSVLTTQLIADVINRSGFDPRRIVAELTETAIIRDQKETQRALEMLCDAGVKIALDDFGTGYSSLNHLHNFPISRIKVDRSITMNVLKSETASSIVQLALSMCESLSIECVVEGVEKTRQQEFLSDVGCRLFQGYLYGRPMPANEVFKFLAREAESGDRVAGASRLSVV